MQSQGREMSDVNQEMPKSNRAGVIVAIVLSIAFVGFIGTRISQALVKRKEVAAQRVEVQAQSAKKEASRLVSPQPITWSPHVDVTGTLRPWREAELAFETTGRLARILVQPGDVVREGAVLGMLDRSRAVDQVSQAEAQVRAAEANATLAEDNLTRTENLLKAKGVSEAQAISAKQQAALAKAQLESAIAASKLARTGAGQNALVAPFAGVITKAPTGTGAVVSPGMPLVRIEDVSRFRLSVTVGEDEVSNVALGAAVAVLYRDKRAMGKVIAIVPSLDQATRRAPVEIEVPNSGSDLLGWGFVRARITSAKEVKALRIPPNAHRAGSQDEVVCVEGGKAKIVRVVHVVDEDGSWIVQSGLTPNDRIVVSPDPELKEGASIELATEITEGK